MRQPINPSHNNLWSRRNHYIDDNDIFGLYNPQKMLIKYKEIAEMTPEMYHEPVLNIKDALTSVDWGEKSGVIVFFPDDAAPLKIGQLSSYSL